MKSRILGACLALMLFLTAGAQAPQAPKRFRLGIQTWTFRMFTLEQSIRMADSAGIRFLEVFPTQPAGFGGTDTFGIRMAADTKAAVKEALRKHDIKIVAMGVVSPRNVREWGLTFQLAQEFGMEYITAEPRHEDLDLVNELAGHYHVRVAIHDHPKPNHYWTPDSVLAAIAGHPNIGACADVGHWARNGVDIVDALKKLSGHVYGVHLKDVSTFNDVKAEDRVVGKGVINFLPIVQELRRQNFTGMISIEHESNWYHNLPDVIEIARYFRDVELRH